MNATRTILLRPRALPAGQCRRPLHVVSSSMDPPSSMKKSSPRPHKQSQNSFVAVAIEEQIPHQPSARDILRLLSNIGAEHRASLPKIESLMQQNASSGRSGGDMPVTSHEMFDLISKIRSM